MRINSNGPITFISSNTNKIDWAHLCFMVGAANKNEWAH